MALVLVLNAGSSSMKWSVVEVPSEKTLVGGNEPLASDAPNLGNIIARAGQVEAVAHRVVHGGARFRRTTRVDEEVLGAIEALAPLDPLHAPRAVSAIRSAQRAAPGTPHFACFDTAFHASLPAAAATYALPHELNARFGLRRFGFHGLSVAHAARTAQARCGAQKIVVAHLGSGCSVTAIANGQSRDTTMGFTPVEGVVMGSRSGSVDPGILLHLLREGALTTAELGMALEREGGLFGLSGVSADLREVVAAADAGDDRAKLAFDVFVHSVRRAIGEMLAGLDGLDALVFTGGIGEHSARVRAEVMAPLTWLGLALDPAKNDLARPDADISATTSGPRVLVIQSREDLTMAREVAALF
jgi:acetate kinase